MVFNLNELLPEKRLDSEILERVFEKNFLDFDGEIKKALEIQSNPKTKKRESSDIQLEMLDLLRGLSSRVSKMESKANKLNQSEGQIAGDTSRINSLLNAKPIAVTALFNALNSNEERMRDNQEKYAMANELFRRLRESDSTSSETGGGI